MWDSLCIRLFRVHLSRAAWLQFCFSLYHVYLPRRTCSSSFRDRNVIKVLLRSHGSHNCMWRKWIHKIKVEIIHESISTKHLDKLCSVSMVRTPHRQVYAESNHLNRRKSQRFNNYCRFCKRFKICIASLWQLTVGHVRGGRRVDFHTPRNEGDWGKKPADKRHFELRSSEKNTLSC